MDEAHLERLLHQINSISDENLLPEEYFIDTSTNQRSAANGGGAIDAGLLQRYTQLKHEYIKRKTQKWYLETVAQGVTSVNSMDIDEEQQEALRKNRQQLLSKLQTTFQEFQVKLEMVKVQKFALSAMKQELLERVAEFRVAQEHQRNADAAGGSPSYAFQRNNLDEDVDLDELTHQGERLVALQQRRAELLAQMQMVKNDTMQVSELLRAEQETLSPHERSLFDPIRGDENEVANRLRDLKTQNAEMEAKIAQYREMTEFYAGMRECLEELRGVRILQVDSCGSDSTSNNQMTTPQPLICVLLLLEKYELEIELQADSTLREKTQLIPVKAMFRNLRLGLDDLIMKTPSSSADTYVYPNGAECLRRIVVEALARIHLQHQRDRELELLRALPSVVEVEVLEAGRDCDGQDDNTTAVSLIDSRVVCRIQANNGHTASSSTALEWIAVLRLTPDCPQIPGSVYLDQLFDQRDEEDEDKDHDGSQHETSLSSSDLQDIHARVNQELCSSPLDLVLHLLKQLKSPNES